MQIKQVPSLSKSIPRRIIRVDFLFLEFLDFGLTILIKPPDCDFFESLVRGEGLEPSRLRIRPSNVRVYQFHHPRG